ncbi:hypothetical protein ZYGR_0H00270 [Zygosaccharomyces rouxii]|uniref:ZYRO0B04642p n=2 Tax=Zygosaccharomyces rouxii TaxID=4956 RepID=C5DR09_ZYGRC|nr:uncharacterized protein ZYRO0B04642g [Zygosaccharomyces rouxii]GAV47187.1 hypothetical protein ZYGR_0H00270 [Zygosaccharomyces rouxii]CAR26220.1 ZYRO0B04642p [Zygosaccharomyces rouxii]
MDNKVTTEYAKVLIAQYLDSHGYQESLVNFLKESDLPRKALLQENGETLETILYERIKFAEHRVANRLARLTLNEPIDVTHLPIPSWDHSLQFKELKLNDRIIDLTVDAGVGSEKLLISTSNREVKVYDTNSLEPSASLEGNKTSGLLKPCGSLGKTGYHYACGLDGMLNVYDSNGGTPVNSYKIHRRVTTHARSCTIDGQSWFFISYGLDNYLKIHRIQFDTLGVELWAECKIPSACTALDIAIVQDRILIYLAQTEFTHVTCYEVTTSIPALNQKYQLALNGAQFTPHAFQIRDMKYVPSENILLVATSHTPYMRLLVVQIPREEETSGPLYDKVIRDMATEVPQDNYSQPSLGILPSNSGVIVSSNEGIYAIDIAKGDSWHLNAFPKRRVKCLVVNDSNGLIAVGFADRTTHIARGTVKT